MTQITARRQTLGADAAFNGTAAQKDAGAQRMRNFTLNLGVAARLMTAAIPVSFATIPLLTSASCSSTTIVTAPLPENPEPVPFERNNGLLNVAFGAVPGQNTSITVTGREVPPCSETDIVEVGPNGEQVTTRQQNGLTFQGMVTDKPDGTRALTGIVRLTMSFRTAIAGQGEWSGSHFNVGTPVVILGEPRYVSTPYLDGQEGKIHLGDIPLGGYVGLNQEVRGSWKEASDKGQAVVGVFMKVVGIEKNCVSAVFGTDTPAGRWQVSTPTMLSEGVSYGTDVLGQARDLGVQNIQVVAMKVRQNDAALNLVINSGEISPIPDALTRARYGEGLQTEIVKSGDRVKELTFSESLMIPENLQLPIFSGDVFLWVTRDRNGEPVIVFSAPYL
ncbi:Uncharacterised protein [Candidatus Burarchaeum australiense]|nr:Uncharacterised protein [Candidatus Burarchaeum australiense]